MFLSVLGKNVFNSLGDLFQKEIKIASEIDLDNLFTE